MAKTLLTLESPTETRNRRRVGCANSILPRRGVHRRRVLGDHGESLSTAVAAGPLMRRWPRVERSADFTAALDHGNRMRRTCSPALSGRGAVLVDESAETIAPAHRSDVRHTRGQGHDKFRRAPAPRDPSPGGDGARCSDRRRFAARVRKPDSRSARRAAAVFAESASAGDRPDSARHRAPLRAPSGHGRAPHLLTMRRHIRSDPEAERAARRLATAIGNGTNRGDDAVRHCHRQTEALAGLHGRDALLLNGSP